MDPLYAPAHGDIRAAHDSGPRTRKNLKLIVLHSTESSASAEGIARYFASKSAGGSANMVVDDNTSYRCLPDLIVPWAAPGGNTQGYHIEHCGFAKWSKSDWLRHAPMLRRSAYKAALRCHEYRIPARFVGALGVRLGRKGITTHRAISFAFPLLARQAGFHTDPGLGFPRAYYLDLVKTYLKKLEQGGNL
jgi:hypothetical protein